MKKKTLLVILLVSGAVLLASCGKSRPDQKTGSAGNVSDAPEDVSSEGMIEDTHQTEYGTELGSEAFTEVEDLLVEETEGEEEQDLILEDRETADTGQVSGAENVKTEENAETADPMAEKEEIKGAPESGAETAAGKIKETAGEKETENLTEAPDENMTEKMTESEAQDLMEDGGPVAAYLDQIGGLEASGQKWSVAYEDLKDGTQYSHKADEKMQSASVIKLFIMGAVYQYMCYPESDEEMINFGESYDGELRDTIEQMITVSSNEAANLLVERLGKGDFEAGKQVVNQFCQDKGFTQTSLGRRFMASDLSQGDNYTSASDVRKFYSEIYHGTLVNADASAKMLEIIKGQTLRNKIPSGLPQGFTSGNKTGEMPDGYGLGCIENDSAIVFPPAETGKEGYILVVLSNDLGGRNSEAQDFISRISSQTAQWYLNKAGATPEAPDAVSPDAQDVESLAQNGQNPDSQSGQVSEAGETAVG